jgi:hypothetical protein
MSTKSTHTSWHPESILPSRKQYLSSRNYATEETEPGKNGTQDTTGENSLGGGRDDLTSDTEREGKMDKKKGSGTGEKAKAKTTIPWNDIWKKVKKYIVSWDEILNAKKIKMKTIVKGSCMLWLLLGGVSKSEYHSDHFRLICCI